MYNYQQNEWPQGHRFQIFVVLYYVSNHLYLYVQFYEISEQMMALCPFTYHFPQRVHFLIKNEHVALICPTTMCIFVYKFNIIEN